jgi:DNA helicase II / ATP-dependent DNA helicase PcrA
MSRGILMREMRYFGPPGTGKTSLLATEKIPKAVERYGSDKVMVASYTRTAAKEIVTKPSRDTGETIPVDHRNVGTLHSLCFRALGAPDLTVKHIKEWNNEYPGLKMSGKSVSNVDNPFGDGMSGSKDSGDIFMSTLNIARSKMIPKTNVGVWNGNILGFEEKWNDFKSEKGLMDFTDLIEESIKNIPYAPGHPRVMFLDEAQDFTPLQLKLVRNWGMDMDWFVLVGDDDQTIFSFTGASPKAFLTPAIDPKYKTVLSQSYRVPIEVYNRAKDIIQRVKFREPKKYFPKNEQGSVEERDESYINIDEVIDDAVEWTKRGKTVMFLASCGYMLKNLIANMREKVIPFHNPYRKDYIPWNPLASSENKIMPKDLLHNFLSTGEDANYWTVQQLLIWTKFLKVGDYGLIRKKANLGLKWLADQVENGAEGLFSTREVLENILSPDAIHPALDRNLSWFLDHMKGKKPEVLQYPIDLLNEHGKNILINDPLISIGTIHSVKGGESDIVILFPDISYNAKEEIDTTSNGLDNMHRLFYVGMTRAKEKLILMSPRNKRRSDLWVEL